MGRKNYDLPVDVNGFSFSKPAFWLDPREYSKIISEINDKYDVLYRGRRVAAHTSFGIDGYAYVYWFEIHGFDNYNIYLRSIDNS